VTDAVFILAPGRSFTSVACAMLGQHPQLYGLPELNLAVTDSMEEWRALFDGGPAAIAGHGLLRAVAELHFGGQSELTVVQARMWIRRRRRWSSREVFHSLAEAARPLGIVDKSPASVMDGERLNRLLAAFPAARFLQLVRHPRTQGESLLNTAWGRRRLVAAGCVDRTTAPPTPDPQLLWLRCHETIAAFLAPLPEAQKRTLRGEDLLADPEARSRELAQWLGLQTDAEAIDAMLHPERSPFACQGPRGARFGNDPKFLEAPELRRSRNGGPPSLDGRLPWRRDGDELQPEVRALAVELGYA
jgi:hypothetical protein